MKYFKRIFERLKKKQPRKVSYPSKFPNVSIAEIIAAKFIDRGLKTPLIYRSGARAVYEISIDGLEYNISDYHLQQGHESIDNCIDYFLEKLKEKNDKKSHNK